MQFYKFQQLLEISLLRVIRFLFWQRNLLLQNVYLMNLNSFQKFSNYLEMHFEWLGLGTVYKYFSPYGSCKIVI